MTESPKGRSKGHFGDPPGSLAGQWTVTSELDPLTDGIAAPFGVVPQGVRPTFGESSCSREVIMEAARPVTSEEYFAEPDVVREYASFEFLLPAERTIREIVGPHLEAARMLDLGVGGGRTTVHFAPLVAHYVGIDSSREMIAACRRRFDDDLPDVRPFFEVGDARDLDGLEPESFDFVLFSFQGLDSVLPFSARRAALCAIYRVLAPGGTLAFSSDNLQYLRATLALHRVLRYLEPRQVGSSREFLRRVLSMRRNLTWLVRSRRLNRTILKSVVRHGTFVYLRRPYELSSRGYGQPSGFIEIDGYAIEPSEQRRQLASLGFSDCRMFTYDGEEAEPETGAFDGSPSVYYLCTKPMDRPLSGTDPSHPGT